MILFARRLVYIFLQTVIIVTVATQEDYIQEGTCAVLIQSSTKLVKLQSSNDTFPYPDTVNDTLNLNLCPDNTTLKMSLLAEKKLSKGLSSVVICFKIMSSFNGTLYQEICYVILDVPRLNKFRELNCWMSLRTSKKLIIQSIVTLSYRRRVKYLYGELYTPSLDPDVPCHGACAPTAIQLDPLDFIMCQHLNELHHNTSVNVLNIVITPEGHESIKMNITSRVTKTPKRKIYASVINIPFKWSMSPIEFSCGELSFAYSELRSARKTNKTVFSLQCSYGGPGRLEVHFTSRGSYCRFYKDVRVECYKNQLASCVKSIASSHELTTIPGTTTESVHVDLPVIGMHVLLAIVFGMATIILVIIFVVKNISIIKEFCRHRRGRMDATQPRDDNIAESHPLQSLNTIPTTEDVANQTTLNIESTQTRL